MLIFLAAAMSFTPTPMPIEYAEIVWEETRETDVDPALVSAIMWTESRYRPRALNPRSRTIGLMQIAPFWLGHFGLTRRQMYDPRTNIRSAIEILEIAEAGHHRRCPRLYGRRAYQRHHEALAHYRCSRRSFRSRACRRSLRSVHRWERRFNDRVEEIKTEIEEDDMVGPLPQSP